MEQVAGAVVGRYEIVRPIGEGGMAQVYLCVRRGEGGFEKRVVMKVLHSKFLSDPEYVSMFLEEARLLSRLEHPNIVSVFEVECVDDAPYRIPYLAMEFVNGPTLARLHKRSIRLGVADLGLTLCIMHRVCLGLHYAHTFRIDGQPAGVVHRDVSSQNILVDGATGTVKLIDFGIAKADLGQAKTEVGVLKGRIQYMAPEVLRGERPDARADLYSVGVLLYRLVTDRSPVGDGETVWSARISGRYPKASEVVPGVSPTMEAIIDRSLRPDPSQRYQSAAELGNDLLREIERMGTDPTHLGGWIQTVFPGGEEQWSKRTDPGSHTGSATHSTLNQLMTAGGSRRSGPRTGQRDDALTKRAPPPRIPWWVKGGLAAGALTGTWLIFLVSLWVGHHLVTRVRQDPVPVPVALQPSAPEVPVLAPALAEPPPVPAVVAPSFTLRSEPGGAEVWSGAVKLGQTPLVLAGAPEPGVRLRLRLPGYEDQMADQTALEGDGALTVRMARLRPARPAPRPVEHEAPPPPAPAGPTRPGVATER